MTTEMCRTAVPQVNPYLAQASHDLTCRLRPADAWQPLLRVWLFKTSLCKGAAQRIGVSGARGKGQVVASGRRFRPRGPFSVFTWQLAAGHAPSAAPVFGRQALRRGAGGFCLRSLKDGS